MKKRILGLLAAFLLLFPVMSVSAAEVSQDNEGIDYTFDCIDGGEVNTQGGGQPKLLIFFSTTCLNCLNTLRDISSSEWIKTGETDVCAIEIVRDHTEDDVRNFRDTYCSEGTIRFAFGGSRGFRAAEEYNAIIGNNNGSISTPLIAMIDVDNKVRFITTGLISASEIEDYLPALRAEEDEAPDDVPDQGETGNPDETPDQGETGKPGDTPDQGETGKPSGVPDKDKTDKVGKSSKEDTETRVACDHVWESVLVNDATATSDAVSADQCKRCGAIIKYEMVPNSAYAAFLNETASTIINTKQEEVVIDTTIWTSFNRTVFSAIQSRPDVAVTVNYLYKGEPYVLQIPAGIDVNLLMDESGFGGFRFIDKVLNELD